MDNKNWFGKSLFIFMFSLFALGALFFYQNAKLNDGKLHLVFCDVGQGDGIYIRTPKGKDILVDTGPDKSILNCLSGNMPFWDREIDIIFLTHSELDHSGGLNYILKRYSVLSFYTEGVFEDEEKFNFKKTVRKKYIWKKDELRLKEGIKITSLWPKRNYLKTDNKNDSSLVQLLTFGDFSALLTGDTSLGQVFDQTEQSIGSIDVLKVPHHGSKTDFEKGPIAKIKPRLAVISVGRKNQYGHPSETVLKILRDLGIKVMRTDLDGEVHIISDGKSFSAKRY